MSITVVLQHPLDGALADAECYRKLFYSSALFLELVQNLPVTAALEQVLLASGHVVDAPGEGTIETGFSQFTAFIFVMTILRW